MIRARSIPVAFLLLASLLSAEATLAGVNSWTAAGPEGGEAYAVAYHPTTPGLVFALSGGEIHRSTNSAQTWTAVQTGAVVGYYSRIVIDPTNPNRVLVSANTALHRSDDAGVTFGAIAPPNGSAFSLAVASDGAVYVSNVSAKIFRSTDFGGQWQERSQGLPATGNISDIVVDPQTPSTLYALIEGQGLYRSTNAGQQWSLLNALTGLGARRLAVDPGLSLHLLAVSPDAGVLASQDGGTTWSVARPGRMAWVGYHPSLPGVALAVPFSGPVLARSSRTAAWTDGQSVVFRGVGEAALDPGAADPNNVVALAATSEGPLFITNSGANTQVRAQGLRGAQADVLAAGRDAQGTVYAAFTTGPVGVHRRTASGWVPADNAELKTLVSPNFFAPTGMTVDPNNPDFVILTTLSGVVRSTDGGQSWTGPTPGLSGLLRTVSFAPSNSQVAYLGSTSGLYRSDNGGITWLFRSQAFATGIAELAVHPTLDGTLYAAADTPFSPPLLRRSVDGGLNWTEVDTGVDAQRVVALALSPSSPTVLYAAAQRPTTFALFKTTDAGVSWSRPNPSSDVLAMNVAVDPLVPTNVFLAHSPSTGGALRSVDGGVTWEGLEFPVPLSVLLSKLILDPSKPSNVIATDTARGLYEFEVAPDLEVTLPAVSSRVALGGTGSATIRVTNRGPHSASVILLTITLPQGMTASIPVPAQGTCVTAASGFRCTLGAVRVNQSVDTVVNLTAGNDPSSATLGVVVAGRENDPQPNNDTRTATIVTERMADLGVTLAASASTVDRRSSVTLTATAVNNGPNAASAASLSLALGSDFTYQNATTSQGACALSGTTVTCSLGNLPSGAQAIASIGALAAGLGSLSAAAQITDGSTDPVPANNAATAGVTSRPVADLRVQLTDAADAVTSGQPLQYVATVTNLGPDDVASATVTVQLAGGNPTSASTTQGGTCTISGDTATCPITSLANGASTTITSNAVAGAVGTATASASVTFQGNDTTTANNTATESTTVNAPPAPSGGGGGPMGWLELLAYLAAAVASRWRTRRGPAN
jgi:uncharacterized repeat protein (TIGR01451 family)